MLRNKLGATDQTVLQDMEDRLTWLRAVELRDSPLPAHFDYAHMKAIHAHVFGDVYEWAGQERVGPDSRMTKEGPDVVNYAPGDPDAPTVAYGYYPGPQIAEAAQKEYEALARENYLQGHGRKEFVHRLAEHWGELNTIHSFREGNTRTQFIFFEQLAENAGYRLDTTWFRPGEPLRDEFVWARFYNQATARTDRLAEVLDNVIHPVGGTPPPASGPDRSLMSAQQRQTLDQYGLQPMGTENGPTYGGNKKPSTDN